MSLETRHRKARTAMADPTAVVKQIDMRSNKSSEGQKIASTDTKTPWGFTARPATAGPNTTTAAAVKPLRRSASYNTAVSSPGNDHTLSNPVIRWPSLIRLVGVDRHEDADDDDKGRRGHGQQLVQRVLSLTAEEVSDLADTFIARFHEQMKLQRRESLLRRGSQ